MHGHAQVGTKLIVVGAGFTYPPGPGETSRPHAMAEALDDGVLDIVDGRRKCKVISFVTSFGMPAQLGPGRYGCLKFLAAALGDADCCMAAL